MAIHFPNFEARKPVVARRGNVNNSGTFYGSLRSDKLSHFKRAQWRSD